MYMQFSAYFPLKMQAKAFGVNGVNLVHVIRIAGNFDKDSVRIQITGNAQGQTSLEFRQKK